jgi:hypothetical protein
MVMNEQQKQSIFSRLDALQEDLEAEPWWSSKDHDDIGRRSETRVIMRQLRMRFLANQIPSDYVLKAIDQLRKPLTKKDSTMVGLSVGYKVPGRPGVEWIDIEGIREPTEAVRAAAKTPEVKKLKAAGYVEHGTAPIVRWEKRSDALYDLDDKPTRRMG